MLLPFNSRTSYLKVSDIFVALQFRNDRSAENRISIQESVEL